MNAPSKITRWISSALTVLGLGAAVTLCQAQSPIVFNFTNGLQGWAGNEPSPQAAQYTWLPAGGSAGTGAMQVVMDGVTTTEMDPIVTLPSTVNEAQYLSVTVEMMVDPNSGTTGASGSGGYGNLQIAMRNASYSYDSIWHGAIYPPAANGWVTYTFVFAPGSSGYPSAEKYLQIQLQGNSGTGYNLNGQPTPITNYIDNITITPLPDPFVLDAFTSDATVGSAWDSAEDAPYTNPLTHTATDFTPPGSWEIQITDPGGYNGWNQYTPSGTMDLTRFQYFGFDVYLDGSTGTSYGGAQVIFFQNGYASTPSLGAISFNSSMVGKWTHIDMPCASMGANWNASPAFSIQGTPGSDGGTNTTTFHVDNLEFWTPQTIASITGLTPGTPGGVQMTVDADGTANQFDQDGITTPLTNNTADMFWINQSPALYSFTLTNFPSPAAHPGFDAHVYLINGDSLTALSGAGDWTYNETYSGVPYNAVDYLGMRIQNSTNGGVQASIEWKTNLPNANPPSNNITVFSLPSLASANGNWALNFSDNTHVSVTGPDGTTVGTVTLPDFYDDPNYTGNFSPATSMVQFGVAKNDGQNTGINNNQSATFTDLMVTNADAGVVIDEPFTGPGVNADYNWQTAEYYLDAANRIVWLPQGTGWWIKWNATSGWSVQSSGSLTGGWANAGVSYSYVDTSGTNTVGAIPSASLPAGNAAYFRLTK